MGPVQGAEGCFDQVVRPVHPERCQHEQHHCPCQDLAAMISFDCFPPKKELACKSFYFIRTIKPAPKPKAAPAAKSDAAPPLALRSRKKRHAAETTVDDEAEVKPIRRNRRNPRSDLA